MVAGWAAPIVLGHGFADAGPLPLSLPVLLVIAAAPVLAAAAVPPTRRRDPVPPLGADLPGPVAAVLRVGVVVVLVAIVVPATLGSADVAVNPAPRLLFTVGWAALLATVTLVGPWWRHASPLRLFADDRASMPLPEAVGVWPAVVALTGFGVAEQILDPSGLVVLVVVGSYLVAGAGGALRYGGAWPAAADPLEVSAELLGSLTPLGRQGRLRWRSPRLGASTLCTGTGAAAFLGVLIGINLYDAAEVAGPPLTQLLMYAAITGTAAVAVTAAARPRWLTPAFVPAAAGHLGAHYLAPLLVETQIAAVLASEPLGLGWNLLGLTGREIIAEPIPPTLGLTLQLVLLIVGHALAMIVATDLARSRLNARAAGAALFSARAALMVSLLAGVYLRFGGVVT